MLKYSKNKVKEKPDTPLTVAWAWLQLLLVVTGLIGISVEFFRDEGWLKRTLSAVVDASTSTLIAVLPVAIIVILVIRSWMNSHGDSEKSSRIADAMLFGMMLVGAWFMFMLVTQGGF